ncbi:MAG: hypothetical protein HZB26_18555 [Candidatus Hydrogenedentes bacterium]|nr:hypothetical protein [Candidatus Hydrogenedentota bacterium]
MFMHRLLTTMVAFAAILAIATPVAAEEATHARISYDGGGGMVKGTLDSDWSYASTNTLILPDDTVWVDKGGTLEMEMAGGTFLRMADQSKAEVTSLPPGGVIRVVTGSFYVQRLSRSSGSVTLRTPACSVEVERDSMARIDVVESGSTTVSVHWGKATVRTDVGSPVVLGANRQCFVDPGYLPSKPMPFTLDREDDFDAWSRERAKTLAGAYTDLAPMRSIANDAPIGAYDLTSYGRWVTVENEPYWQPTVVADYVPYRAGHWSYVPCYGYVWVGGYPFSYVTTHYGRWSHHDNYGWLWTYRNTWSPAWVASVRYGSNFMWCPLDPFDRPCSYGSSYFTLGGMNFGISPWSYCPADTLFLGYAPVYACTPDFMHGVSPADIFLWDIFARGRYSGRSPFSIPNLPLRDYSPRRVIRGPDTLGPNTLLASQRINSLEAVQRLTTREGSSITGGRGQRTATEQGVRNARTRSVAVDRSLEPATAQLLRRGGHTPDGLAGTTNRVATRSSAPGASIPPAARGATPQITDRTSLRAPRVTDSAVARRADATPTTATPRTGAAGVTPTPQREGSRVVRLTNPSTARPPDASRSATVWRDLPVREDGNAVPSPQRTPSRTRIAEQQDSPLRGQTTTPRYDGAITNRARGNSLQSPSTDNSSTVHGGTTPSENRTLTRRLPSESSPAETPITRQIDRQPRHVETNMPQIAERQTQRFEAPAPQRFESAPRVVERQPAPRYEAPPRVVETPAPRFEAPSRVIQAPAPRIEAPRFEAPRVAPSQPHAEVARPSYTPPSRDTSVDNALRGNADHSSRSSGFGARGR